MTCLHAVCLRLKVAYRLNSKFREWTVTKEKHVVILICYRMLVIAKLFYQLTGSMQRTEYFGTTAAVLMRLSRGLCNRNNNIQVYVLH